MTKVGAWGLELDVEKRWRTPGGPGRHCVFLFFFSLSEALVVKGGFVRWSGW